MVKQHSTASDMITGQLMPFLPLFVDFLFCVVYCPFNTIFIRPPKVLLLFVPLSKPIYSRMIAVSTFRGLCPTAKRKKGSTTPTLSNEPTKYEKRNSAIKTETWRWPAFNIWAAYSYLKCVTGQFSTSKSLDGQWSSRLPAGLEMCYIIWAGRLQAVETKVTPKASWRCCFLKCSARAMVALPFAARQRT